MTGRFLGPCLLQLLMGSINIDRRAFKAAALRVESNQSDGENGPTDDFFFDPTLFTEDGVWTTTEDIDEADSAEMGRDFHAEESCEGDCFQGDILVHGELPSGEGHLPPGMRGSLLEVLGPRVLWPNGIIYYKWSPTIGRKAKDTFIVGMDAWMEKTCIKFVEITDAEQKRTCAGNSQLPQCYAVHLTSDGVGCGSHLGYQKISEQKVNLGKGCWNTGTVLHELGHTIGLSHEQERQNRDEYIQVAQENVKPQLLQYFKVNPWRSDATKELPYDLSSVMHYSEWSFAVNKDYKNASSRTITVVKPDSWGNCRIGQRDRLSPGDILTVGTLYNCPKLFCIDHSYKCSDLSPQDCEGGNATWMKKICPKLCGVCKCSDTDKDCAKLVATSNICATQNAVRCSNTCGLCTPSEVTCKDDPYIKKWGAGFSCKKYASMTAGSMHPKNAGDLRPGCHLQDIRQSCPWTCGSCPARPFCF